MKISVFLGISLALVGVLGNSHVVMGEEILFKDYNLTFASL